MAKNIVIAKLDIDTQSLMDSTQKTAKQLENLREQQDKLVKKGKETSEQFMANEAAIRKLEAAHRAQIAALDAQTTADGKLLSMKKAVKDAVNEVNNSENDYMRSNERLIALKKQLNSNDGDYEKNLGRINAKLLENTNWLKENGSANAKLVTTMNDYKQQVAESFDQINILNGGFSGLVSRAQEAGGVGPLVAGAFNGMATGMMGMTKSAMAFIATPIGFVLAALAAVFALVQNAMNSSTESANKITKIFNTFSIITDALMGLLEPLGSFLIDGIAAGFEMAGKAAETAVGWIADGLSFLGFDDSAESVRGFTEEVKNTVAETNNLKTAQEKLASQMALQELANEKAKNDIDDLIKKSRDQTLSEEDRMDALKKAAKIEKDNLDQRKKQANEAYNLAVRQAALGKGLTEDEIEGLRKGGLAYAQKLQKVKGFTKEEMDVLQKAQLERNKLMSEEKQLVAQQLEDQEKLREEFAARREAAEQKRLEKQRQRIDEAIQRQKLELDLYIAQQGIKTKSMQEELAMAEEVSKRKIAIAQAELDSTKKTYNDRKVFEIAKTEADNDLMAAQARAAAENADKEVQAYIAASKIKLEQGVFLSDELYQQEAARLDAIAKKELESLTARLATQELKQEEYDSRKAAITEITNKNMAQLEEARTEAKNAKEAIDLENKRAVAVANMDYDLSFQQQQLDMKMAQELEAAEKTGADETLIREKYAKLKKDTETAVMNNKLDLANSTFSNLATIMGKESAAGKAMAVAQATIDTYKSAVSAYSAMSTIPIVGPALGAVAAAAAVAAGIANVKKITATKAPKAEKGALFSIGGQRHSAGGTMFTGADGTQFEAEQGELIGVMNRNAARHFMAFNNAFPAGGSGAPNYFAGGGIVSREISQQPLNVEELAARISEANRALPVPVVAVQDIIAGGESYVKVRDSANF